MSVFGKTARGLWSPHTPVGVLGRSLKVRRQTTASSSAANHPAGWTKAFVSAVYSFDSCSPTILECLLFWLVSAMGLPGSWEIPEVGFEPEYRPLEHPCAVYDVMMQQPKAAIALSLFS
jgi:hypothetical protein